MTDAIRVKGPMRVRLVLENGNSLYWDLPEEKLVELFLKAFGVAVEEIVVK